MRKKVQNLVNQQASSSVPCMSDVWDYCALGHLHIEKRSELSVNAMTSWGILQQTGRKYSFLFGIQMRFNYSNKSPNFTDPLAFPAKLIVSSRLFLSVYCVSSLPQSVFQQCRVLRKCKYEILLGGHFECYRHSKLTWSSQKDCASIRLPLSSVQS